MNTTAQKALGLPRSAILIIVAILISSWTAAFASAANAESNRDAVEVKAIASQATVAIKTIAQPKDGTATKSTTKSSPFQRGVLDDSVLAPWKRLLQGNDGTIAFA